MASCSSTKESFNCINLFDILPTTIWSDIYGEKTRYRNVEELYNLNSETRETLLYMIKFGLIKLFYGIIYISGRITENYKVRNPVEIDTNNIDCKRVIQVAAGSDYSLFVCEDGSVYGYDFGLFGLLEEVNELGTFIPINMNEKTVIQVSTSLFHSLFVCKDGSVYASGNGIFGVLGDGRIEMHVEDTPIPINIHYKHVIQAAAGEAHSLFLCKDGSVYASGRGIYGVLGDGRTDRHEVGIPIPINTSNMNGKRVIQVSAGKAHSLFLCENGSVYASGFGQSGVLGDGRIDLHNEGIPIPIDISNMNGKRVIQVSACLRHSLFLCEDGSVYSSGNGTGGRLGDGRTDEHFEGTPIAIDTANMQGKRVIQVAAGKEHSLFLCEDGTVYSSGNGSLGQLGDGIIENHQVGTPTLINMNEKSVIQVAAGTVHSLFLT